MALMQTMWNENAIPISHTFESVMDAIYNDDMQFGLIYDCVSMDDLTENVSLLSLDGIVSPYIKLDMKMRAMQRVMNNSGSELNVVSYQLSEPFMRQGTANVVALFELSDGQTISVFFHNPDTTPKKITPDDIVTSWKWLLNKKDVSVVVAPEKGQEIDVRQVAMRIMKIAQKNSAAFQRMNAKRAEKTARLSVLEKETAEKEQLLDKKLKQLDTLKAVLADMEAEKAIEQEKMQQMQENDPTTPEGYAKIYGDKEKMIAHQDALDSLFKKRIEAVRKALITEGWNGSHYQTPMKGTASFAAETNKLVAYHYNILDVTYIVMQPGKEEVRIADMLDKTPKEIAKILDDAVEQVQPATNPTSEPEQITITGKEFGVFDLSNEEGKKQLRQVVREHLENNLKGKWVKNYALNRDIEIRQRGIEEMISWSANPKKLQIAAVIEQVIATAKPKDDIEPWEENTKKVKKPDVKGYYRFTNNVNIGGENVNFDVLIEQDEKGLLHYDFILPKKPKAIMDNVGIGFDTQSKKDQQTTMASDDSNHNAILDGAQAEYMINIILLDEEGNEIEDEEIIEQTEFEPVVITGKEFGEFDTLTEEGKSALREKAFEHLKSLAERGETVFCKAVNADVRFVKSAAKKYKQASANPVKSMLAFKLKELIANGVKFKDSVEDYEGKVKLHYHYLKTLATVNGEEYGVRLVIRQDGDGNYHYDLQVKDDFDTILDSIKGSPARLTKSDVASLEVNDRSGSVNKTDFFYHSVADVSLDNVANLPNKYGESHLTLTQPELQLDDTLTLDDVSSGYVLNLFVFDKDGNEIKDEEETNDGISLLTTEDLQRYTQLAKEKGYVVRLGKDIQEVYNPLRGLVFDKEQDGYTVRIKGNFNDVNREYNYTVAVLDTDIDASIHFYAMTPISESSLELRERMGSFNSFEEALAFADNALEKVLQAIQSKNKPIIITGKEFGEFDTSTPEGKKALREKAFEHIQALVDNKEIVYCAALDANVSFTKSANKKYQSESSGKLGSVKSQLAFKIKELIASGKQYKAKSESYDYDERRGQLKYHYLKTNAVVGEQEFTVKLVIRETPEKTFHYDLQLKEGLDQIMDNVNAQMAEVPFLCHLSQVETSATEVAQSELQLDDTLTLDDVSSGYVLNLFVFDKDGNEIKDEEDEGSELTIKLSNAYDYVLEKIFNGNKDGQLLTVTNPETKEIIYSKFYDKLPKTFSKILDNTQKRYKNYDVEFKNAPKYSGSPDIQSEELNKLSAALLKQLGYEIDETVSQEKLESLPFPEGSYVARTINEIEYAYSVEKYLNLHSKDREPSMVVKDLSGDYIGRHDISFVKENFRQVSKEEAEMIAAKFNYEEVARYENSKGTLIALVSKNTYGYDVGVEDGRKPINMEPLGKVIEHLKYLKEINPSMKCVKGMDLLNGYEVKPEKDFLEPVNLKPRKPTLKQLGISDSSSRIIKSINERYPNGWATMHFADVNTPAYIQAAIDSDKYFVTENDIGRVMHMAQSEKATPVTAANEGKMKVVVLKSENLQMAINAHYFNYFMYHYPNAEVFIANSETMAGFKVNNELVGVVMGMNLGGAFRAKIDATLNEQAAKESEVNNEQQGEPMQPEEKTQLAEDIQFLQDVINGKVDVFASDFNGKLLKLATELQLTHSDLVNEAAQVYAAKMAEKAKQALGAM